MRFAGSSEHVGAVEPCCSYPFWMQSAGPDILCGELFNRQMILCCAEAEGCSQAEEKVEKGSCVGVSRLVAASACWTRLFGDSKSSGVRSIE